MNDRFFVTLQTKETPNATLQSWVYELQNLVQQINAAKIPLVIGPGESIPDGILPGQPVIDWRTGVSSTKIWNGKQLV